MKSIPIHFRALTLSWVVVAGLFAAALLRIEIDTDITRYLPQKDPVIADAGYVFMNHPIQDRLVMDIGYPKGDPDALVECGERVEQKLKESGLFKEVGTESFQNLMPELIVHILDNLPVMFTQRDLDDNVKPLLEGASIPERLEDIRTELLNLGGIGQSRFISRDPLGLRNLVLARLSHLAPLQKVEIYRGKILSPDREHLLLVTHPNESGTDTAFARKLADLFETVRDQVNRNRALKEGLISLTPVGAYRAALDNEIIAKRDVRKAILLVTVGITLLLVFAFPRPLLGLFAFLPAIAGTVGAFFLFSLLHRSISIMVLGFGAAVISITVDHAIAFLLFLDQPHATSGKDASREIRTVGLLAALTTIGAFGALCLSGFPLFEQIGQFTAFGIAFSFIFVHMVFPTILPSMPAARPRLLPLRPIVSAFFSLGKTGAVVAFLFVVGMSFFARPEFNVDLNAMNTVSQDTAAAEKLVADVWGSDMFRKTFLLTEAESVKDIQDKGDRLLEAMEPDIATGVIASGFVPSMMFPGKERREQNLKAWTRFWNPGRIAELKRTFSVASEMGFASGAFEPFYNILSAPSYPSQSTDIPDKFLDFLGIAKRDDGYKWTQLSSLTPGESYDGEKFYATYRSFGKIFDPSRFSIRMGELLFSTFIKMLYLVGVSVIVLLIFFFLDWKLTLVSLLPILFALVSTVGTLNLIGHPLDIPGLMLSIVVVGMGIDYSLFIVRAYQRYGDESHPSFELIKMTVFMASASTIIGFAALTFAEHSMLKSAGLTSLFGISYALIGAFLILPPILKHMFQTEAKGAGIPRKTSDLILGRYRKMEPYFRLFARFKLMLDPMFSDLPRFFDAPLAVRTIIDIDIGYGVPACWLLERFPDAKVYGIDPDPERVRVASIAMGERGVAECGNAPHVPTPPEPADAALILDVIHFLNDDDLKTTLERIRKNLGREGILVVRAVIPPEKSGSWMWKMQAIKMRVSNSPAYFRSIEKINEMIVHAGFTCKPIRPLQPNEESVWFVGKAVK
ncbi:MAG: methyltransferase domain-containing protein [Candidatus Desulfacyla sp.]